MRRMGRWWPAAVLLLSLTPATGAEGDFPFGRDNSAEAACLTIDGQVIAGKFLGFTDGYFRFQEGEGEVRVSPAHVQAVFASRAKAEAARDNPQFLKAHLSTAAELERLYYAGLPDTETFANDDFFGQSLQLAMLIARKRQAEETLLGELMKIGPADGLREPASLLRAIPLRKSLLLLAILHQGGAKDTGLRMLYRYVRQAQESDLPDDGKQLVKRRVRRLLAEFDWGGHAGEGGGE